MQKFEVGDWVVRGDVNGAWPYGKRPMQVTATDTKCGIGFANESGCQWADVFFSLAKPEELAALGVSRGCKVPEPESLLETQVGGSHYTKMGIQPFEACYQNFGLAGLKASIYTKVLKYFRTKGDAHKELEDLKKARHSLSVLIEKAEKELA